jgi:BON domain
MRAARRLFLAGAVIGAGLEFLFDPRVGHRRRTYLRDRLRGITRRRARRSRRFVRMLGAYGRGYGSRLFHRRPAERREPDDVTLAHKVETELFRPADVPKGQINVNVQNGVVQLRGEVPQPEMIRKLVEQARDIAGVRDVENLLHLPGTPAPMHE